MANKSGLPANEGVVEPEEPGAVDNRLSLIPSDFPAIQKWEDGEEYDPSELGEGVKLRQISAGEFEVIPGPPVPGAAAEEEAEAAPAPKRAGYSNRAVEELAEEG